MSRRTSGRRAATSTCQDSVRLYGKRTDHRHRDGRRPKCARYRALPQRKLSQGITAGAVKYPSSPAHPRQNAVAGRACDRKGSKHHARRIHHSEPRAGARTRRLGCRGHEDPGRTRCINAENPDGGKGRAAMAASALGPSRKGSPCISTVRSGESVTLMDVEGPGVIRHIWMTVTDRTSPPAPTCYAT